MESSAAKQPRSVYLNISAFLVIFAVTGYFTTSAASNGLMSYFKKQTYREITLHYARQLFAPQNLDEVLKLVARIYFSSFLKDAVFSTLSPKLMKSQVSPKLVAKVQAATFNESWIPDASYDEYARRNSASSKSAPPSKKTSVYYIGHYLIEVITGICQFFSSIFLKLVLWVEWGLAHSSNGAIGFVFFTVRSIFCWLSSTSLMILHFIQVILRTVKVIYKLLEVVLARSCAIVNDFSLLSVDIIQAAAVNRGDKTFTRLANRGPFGGGDGQSR